jgi:hypothetical protein
MRKIINLGFGMAMLSSLLISSCLPVKAGENKLPKVGFVKSSESGAGCSYSFAQDKRKKSIFVNLSGATMNFDGQDIKLVKISGKSKKSVDIDDYTANNLKIRVVTISNNKQDFTVKGTITIKSGSNSKVIKFDGYCGC